MPWFPVIPEQVAAVESALGVALPSAYKAIVGDSRYRQLLAHPTVGAIDLAMSMHDFAAHTAHRRATLPGFPRRLDDARDDPHRAVAGGTRAGIDLEELLEERRPPAGGLRWRQPLG